MLCISTCCLNFHAYCFSKFLTLFCPCRVLAAAAQRLGQENEGMTGTICFSFVHGSTLKSSHIYELSAGSNGKSENGSDNTKRDHLMPDLCVICLEQEYNAVFVP